MPLAPLTTFRIGGPAGFFVSTRTPDELASVVSTARSLGIPWFLLGRGANILVGDRGFRGLVVHNQVQGIDFLDDTSVRAGAGVETFPDLIDQTVAESALPVTGARPRADRIYRGGPRVRRHPD